MKTRRKRVTQNGRKKIIVAFIRLENLRKMAGRYMRTSSTNKNVSVYQVEVLSSL